MTRDRFPRLDRSQLRIRPVTERKNRASIERDRVAPESTPAPAGPAQAACLRETLARIRASRERGKPVVLVFGAHAIKNGLGPVLIALMQKGWLTHLGTNGAGIIHDWEFSYLGETSEHVHENVLGGNFGIWEETGYFINLAINVGAHEGRGYGESVGALIDNEGLAIPSEQELASECRDLVDSDPEQAASAADLLAVVRRFKLQPGRMPVGHRWKHFSAQAAAFRLGIPFTAHPMIGHDVIYTHPMNHGASIGRAALRDFLTFAATIRNIDDGIYISIGSAVMSPMVFEKSLSMSQNLALQEDRPIRNHHILVVDLAESSWDWTKGEPPEHDPAYYLRYNKTFSRMGGTMRYLRMDNRDFLLHLHHGLES
jgi:hypothetical protein